MWEVSRLASKHQALLAEQDRWGGHEAEMGLNQEVKPAVKSWLYHLRSQVKVQPLVSAHKHMLLAEETWLISELLVYQKLFSRMIASVAVSKR